jgi:hypothetical protein
MKKNYMGKIISLEGIVNNRSNKPLRAKPLSLKEYNKLKRKNRNNKSFKDKVSGAKVEYVPLSELQSTSYGQILGVYNPKKRTMFIAEGLHPLIELFTYVHERWHARGIRNEILTDILTAKEVGYMLKRNYSLYDYLTFPKVA